MPKVVRTPQIQTRLSREDNTRLDRFCVTHKKTKTQVTRDAIRWYLDHFETLDNLEHESFYAKEVRRMADRIIAFMVPLRTQVGTMYELTYNTCENEEFFNTAKSTAVQKIRKQLPEEEKSIAKNLKKVLTGDSEA